MPTHHFVPALDAAAEAEAKWLTEVLLGRPDCDNFRKLEELRRTIRAAGITIRLRSPPTAFPDPAAHWANIMFEVLKSIDQDPEQPYGFTRYTAKFLVVGSNLDGFARYILRHVNASGVGVTLPADSGGVGWATPPSNRFELPELDLFDLVSRYRLSDPVPLALPLTFTTFDSIILDMDSSRPHILIAQLLLALHTIFNGGQILLTLSSIERPLTARILIAFSKIADHITAFKPRVRAWDRRFYLHAQAIRHNSAYRKLRYNTQRLYNIASTRDPTWVELDSITPWEEVLKKSNVDLIVRLGNPLWGTQLTALNKAFDQIN